MYMRPAGGMESFQQQSPTTEPFNGQLAEQLRSLSESTDEAESDEAAVKSTDESAAEAAESAEFQLSDPEQVQALKDTMQEFVAEAEQLRSRAAAIGFSGMQYEACVGEACFTELHKKFDELIAVLEDYQTEYSQGSTREVTDEEYDEIQSHIESIAGLRDTIEVAVFNADEKAANSVDGALEEQETQSVDRAVESDMAVELIDMAHTLQRTYADRFPHAVRTEEVSLALAGLLSDSRQLETLSVDGQIDTERLREFQESIAAYDTELERLYTELLPDIKAIRGEGSEAEDPAEPLVLSEDMRVQEGEGIEYEATREAAKRLVRGIDENPYFAREERTTIKWFYDDLVKAVSEPDMSEATLTQKLTNLETAVAGIETSPSVEALRERAERVRADINFLPEDAQGTATAMFENFMRQYQAPDTPEEQLQTVYEALQQYVVEEMVNLSALFGQALPEAGEDSIDEVRALRRRLIEVAADSSREFSRSQKSDIEEMIAVLTYAAHDTLTETQAAAIKQLATRVRASQPILPYEEPQVEEAVPVEVSDTTRTGLVAFSSEEDSAADTDQAASIPVRSAVHSESAELPTEVTEAGSLEPETFEESWPDTDSWENTEDTDTTAEAVETAAAEEPVADAALADTESRESGEAVQITPTFYEAEATNDIDTTEDTETVSPAEPRPTVRNWEARREAGSFAKKYINADLAAKLKERDITPRDLDRKVKSFVSEFDRRFVSRLDTWFGEAVNSVFTTWQDKPLQEFYALANQYTAANKHELEDEHKVKYEAFVGWQDLVQQEMVPVVANYNQRMPLAELVTLYIALSETQ